MSFIHPIDEATLKRWQLAFRLQATWAKSAVEWCMDIRVQPVQWWKDVKLRLIPCSMISIFSSKHIFLFRVSVQNLWPSWADSGTFLRPSLGLLGPCEFPLPYHNSKLLIKIWKLAKLFEIFPLELRHPISIEALCRNTWLSSRVLYSMLWNHLRLNMCDKSQTPQLPNESSWRPWCDINKWNEYRNSW